ncbi:hypothetical protein J437_LFUL007974, partial [Ladona fulva]
MDHNRSCYSSDISCRYLSSFPERDYKFQHYSTSSYHWTNEDRLNDDWDFSSSDSDINVPDSPYESSQQFKKSLQLWKLQLRRRIKILSEGSRNPILYLTMVIFALFLLEMLLNVLLQRSLTALHTFFMSLTVFRFYCQFVLRVFPDFPPCVPYSLDGKRRYFRLLKWLSMTFYLTGLSFTWFNKTYSHEGHYISWHGIIGQLFLLFQFLSDNRIIPSGLLKPLKRYIT